jgi:hypothetical protein
MHAGGIVMFAVIGIVAVVALAWYGVQRHRTRGASREHR